jgi:DNA-directed RNA polymerase specialized sigma24 family protein
MKGTATTSGALQKADGSDAITPDPWKVIMSLSCRACERDLHRESDHKWHLWDDTPIADILADSTLARQLTDIAAGIILDNMPQLNDNAGIMDAPTSYMRAVALAGVIVQILMEYDGLLRHLEKQVINAAQPEDLLQDILLKMLASPPEILAEHGQPAEPFIRAVIVHDDIDRWRAHRRHKKILGANVLVLHTWLSAGSGEHGTESAETAALRNLAEQEMLSRIMRLPPHLARVALLTYLGLPPRKSAKILNIPVNRVYKSLQDIRSPRIRHALGRAA